MIKLLLISFLTLTNLFSTSIDSDINSILADVEKELIADYELTKQVEKEMQETEYYIMTGNKILAEDLINSFSSGPIEDYKINNYLEKYNKQSKNNKIIMEINKNMKKFFPEKKDLEIKKIVIAMMKVESEYNIKAIGDLDTNSPAYGIMQVRLSTADYMNKQIPFFKKYKNKSEKWLSKYLHTLEGGIEYGMGYLYFKKKYNKYKKTNTKDKFFTMISLYNGGKYNHRYVNKVFKVIQEMENI